MHLFKTTYFLNTHTMKQLLLYFLFFIAAALILLQCARLFPTLEKKARQSANNKTTASVAFKNLQKAYVSFPGDDRYFSAKLAR
jgi:hypothetical protein